MKIIFEVLGSEDYQTLIVVVFLVLVSGTLFYHFIEEWTLLDSLYFSIVSLTTVGFGDYSPKTAAGKVFTILYLFVGIGLLMLLINAVTKNTVVKRLERKIDKKTIKKKTKKKKSKK